LLRKINRGAVSEVSVAFLGAVPLKILRTSQGQVRLFPSAVALNDFY
jgi:hypothetical protein